MILGQKVRLRAIERDDLPTFVRWFNDPEVRHYLTAYMPMSLAEEEKWFEGQLQKQDGRIFAIEVIDGDQPVHIGNVGIHDVDWKNRAAEVGIVIGEKDYWGKGYGTDALKTLLRFAFQEMNLHRVQLRVHDYNARALRCYEKCGFQHEGRQRQALFRDGEYHDVLLMGILAGEFQTE
ncbi:MAG TPA: N-acetyltransferase [Anaerolineae bacterium]|nr:N-acetyltransferase [Anaerolineae bacterium]